MILPDSGPQRTCTKSCPHCKRTALVWRPPPGRDRLTMLHANIRLLAKHLLPVTPSTIYIFTASDAVATIQDHIQDLRYALCTGMWLSIASRALQSGPPFSQGCVCVCVCVCWGPLKCRAHSRLRLKTPHVLAYIQQIWRTTVRPLLNYCATLLAHHTAISRLRTSRALTCSPTPSLPAARSSGPGCMCSPLWRAHG